VKLDTANSVWSFSPEKALLVCTTHQRASQRRPIYVAITKSNDLAEKSLPDKAGSFDYSTTARIVNHTGDDDLVYLMHLQRMRTMTKVRYA